MQDDELNGFIKSHEGKSRDALLEELTDMTRQQKLTGEMSNTKMEEIYELLYPMLSPAQREKMLEVIARLKE